MVLESMCHPENAFITLTYDDNNLPPGGTLVPADTQKWMKKLRKRYPPKSLRYYLVGEYGDHTERPHYHLALFGAGPAEGEIVQETWGLGWTTTHEFNRYTAQYICGYVVKKMTKEDDSRLYGRHPEFSRMSNRPGIGAGAMEILSQQLGEVSTVDGDIPDYLMIGARRVFLGSYLKEKLRQYANISASEVKFHKDRKGQAYAQEMLELYLSFEDDPEVTSQKEALIKSNTQKFRNVEARSKLSKGRKL